jgi:hypothetical protein
MSLFKATFRPTNEVWRGPLLLCEIIFEADDLAMAKQFAESFAANSGPLRGSGYAVDEVYELGSAV